MRKHEDMEPGAGKRSLWQQPKLWVAGVLGLYLLLLLVANNDDTPVHLIFTTLTIPLYALILLVGALAFAIGWILGRSAGRRSRKD